MGTNQQTGERPDEVESLMVASRALVAVAARSLAEVGDSVTLPQMRILILVDALGPLALGRVATELGVHPSNATRLADRLVTAELLDRRPVSDDRRSWQLVLTRRGQELIDRVTGHRRKALQEILSRMPGGDRELLASAFAAFAEAAGEPRGGAATTLGWRD